jgi:hypothetical protein
MTGEHTPAMRGLIDRERGYSSEGARVFLLARMLERTITIETITGADGTPRRFPVHEDTPEDDIDALADRLDPDNRGWRIVEEGEEQS